MPYLGNEPGAITDAFTQTFTGDGSETAFTLTTASTTNAVFVRISGVMQRNGTDFNVDGVTLTFTTAPPALSNNIVVQFFTVGSIQTIADDAVATAKIADNAVTLAKLAGGTDGNLITFDASGDPAFVATGSSGQLLTSAGAGSPPTFTTVTSGPTEATKIATTSGSSFTFSGIASGTKRVTLCFRGLSWTDSTHTMLVQLGDGGGIETSGYLSGSKYIEGTSIAGQANSTAGFIFRDQYGASASANGYMQIVLADAGGFDFVANGQLHSTGTGHAIMSGGKSLSAELTQLKVSGFTGDAGFINLVLG